MTSTSNSYKLLSDASPSVDQLAYWPAHKEHFPILSHLAIQVKSIGLRQGEEIMNEEKMISFAKVYGHFNFLDGFLIF